MIAIGRIAFMDMELHRYSSSLQAQTSQENKDKKHHQMRLPILYGAMEIDFSSFLFSFSSTRKSKDFIIYLTL